MPFAAVERPRLVQDADRDRGLADIVQQPGLGQELGVVPAHAGGQREGGEVGGDPERMGEGVVVVRCAAPPARRPSAARTSASTSCCPARRALSAGELAAAGHGAPGLARAGRAWSGPAPWAEAAAAASAARPRGRPAARSGAAGHRPAQGSSWIAWARSWVATTLRRTSSAAPRASTSGGRCRPTPASRRRASSPLRPGSAMATTASWQRPQASASKAAPPSLGDLDAILARQGLADRGAAGPAGGRPAGPCGRPHGGGSARLASAMLVRAFRQLTAKGWPTRSLAASS